MNYEEFGNEYSPVVLKVSCFDGSTPVDSVEKEIILAGKEYRIDINSCSLMAKMTCLPDCESDVLKCEIKVDVIEGSLNNANIAAFIDIHNWSRDNYVMLPAAVYNGNRYKKKKCSYPPFLNKDDEIGLQMPVIISDVPALNPGEGKSEIHLRSGDMSTPCISFCGGGRGFILLGEDTTPYGYTGYLIRENMERTKAKIGYEVPAVRQTMYQMCNNEVP